VHSKGALLIALLGFRTINHAAETYGVGVALAKHPMGFLVAKIITNSPAAQDGSIVEGDLITGVAEANASPVSLEGLKYVQDAVAMIRGSKGTVVRLTVVPGATNTSQTKIVSLVRGELRGIPFGGLWLSLTNAAAAPDPEFVRLDGGGREKLSSFNGRIVILDFWATWCGPCLKHMPGTQKLARKFARKDVLWITVSIWMKIQISQLSE